MLSFIWHRLPLHVGLLQPTLSWLPLLGVLWAAWSYNTAPSGLMENCSDKLVPSMASLKRRYLGDQKAHHMPEPGLSPNTSALVCFGNQGSLLITFEFPQ